MGVAYKACHRGLGRLVALKMMLAGQFASPKERLRFQLEAELAARVQHPHIVQVYEVGTHEGRPYLAMEWVEGGSLADRLDGTPWPEAEAARLVETLARAIHAAHGQAVIHRDLKPANILLQPVATPNTKRHQQEGKAGEGPPRSPDPAASPVGAFSCFSRPFFPKIADFGLAQPMQRGKL